MFEKFLAELSEASAPLTQSQELWETPKTHTHIHCVSVDLMKEIVQSGQMHHDASFVARDHRAEAWHIFGGLFDFS